MSQLKLRFFLFGFLLVFFFASPDGLAEIRHVPSDYPTIQSAVNACANGDTVLIADGIFTGPGNRGIVFNTLHTLTIQSENGPDACIIDCQQLDRAFLVGGYLRNFSLSGLTIQNGISTGNGHGGAMQLEAVTIDMLDCNLINCACSKNGGAVYALNSTLRIARCNFSNNQAPSTTVNVGVGGAIYALQSRISFTDSRFTGNNALRSGGAICIMRALPQSIITRCIFESNGNLDAHGGGIYIQECTDGFTISNCAFSGNSGDLGGAIVCGASNARIESCTILSNLYSSTGGGLYAWATPKPEILNCIFYNNGSEIATDSGTLQVTYSDVAGASPYPGAGNINQDPRIGNGPLGDYYLNQTLSPCINAGSTQSSEICYESFLGLTCQSALTTSATGIYDSGVVDMGCHFISDLSTPTPTPTLPPTPTMCSGSMHEMTIIEEHFETWPPAGWSIINNGGDCVWQSTATTDRLNYATFSGEAAVADSDWCGVMSSMNTELMTPLLNLSAYSQASLDFVIAYQSAGYDAFEIRVSTNGGTSWNDEVLLWEDTTHQGYGPGQAVRVNLTPFISAQTKVRFSYRAPDVAYWAIIDDIFVKVCVPNTTPSSTPTFTPTYPPTPTPPPPPTNTPTPTTIPGSPTNTQLPASPTAEPTAGCSLLGCVINMPSNDFGSGDECYCNVTACNTDSYTYTDIPVFVVLDVAGSYFFAPDYSEFDFYTMTLPPGETVIPVLPSFEWPSGVGAFSGVNWYAAMTNPDITALHGELDIFTFGWH